MVHELNKSRCSPLFLVAASEKVEIVNLLLQIPFPADQKLRRFFGNSLLHAAILKRNSDSLEPKKVKGKLVYCRLSTWGSEAVKQLEALPNVAAPGINILASFTPMKSITGQKGDTQFSEFTLMFGTSMSCPHVAGVAAYVKSFHPDWNPAAIRSTIISADYGQVKDLPDQLRLAYANLVLEIGNGDPLRPTERVLNLLRCVLRRIVTLLLRRMLQLPQKYLALLDLLERHVLIVSSVLYNLHLGALAPCCIHKHCPAHHTLLESTRIPNHSVALPV
ncbi:hypothetical protein JHK82_047936 [Glycine max]|nr:hypothetical protein JHK82_047936 [Glycine max]